MKGFIAGILVGVVIILMILLINYSSKEDKQLFYVGDCISYYSYGEEAWEGNSHPRHRIEEIGHSAYHISTLKDGKYQYIDKATDTLLFLDAKDFIKVPCPNEVR